ncbi:protein Simiate-like isoform X2 [Temnothorax curvispinosus]|uniref:Protein Abitram n=1 Tax=Temnothorax curvispinosus TaxID=300111 RepID=A0A6J1RFR9_9HYME|nr:protein Simiate-like isoform X1 [Temnothorax curvispinosus]XP_024893613.1 protein Simiate-like isoform X2 [Temnothorax curvispinosus]
MNLISEADGPKTKRMKSENDERRSCDQKEEDDVRENVAEGISDGKEISQQEEHERSVDSDNEASATVDSDDESFTFPPDEDITDMLDEVQYNGYFPTVTDRYFTPYYKTDVQSPGDDMCVWIHSNRICMLSLAPSHVILRSNKGIEKVDFRVSDKLDRSLNKVSGKGKHGAQPLQTNSNVCTISCLDGQTYVIKCCMIGKLVEVNEALSEDPQLLKGPPHKGGYLAIILPNIKLLESLKQSLLTHEQYIELVEEREKK